MHIKLDPSIYIKCSISYIRQKNKYFREKSMICNRIVDINTAQISLLKHKNEKA